jgi:hypothetical protein
MTWPTSKPDRELDARASRGRIPVVLGAASVLAASFMYAPWVGDGPVLCPSRFFTGIPCPACGLTRSFCAMASGDIGQAFAFHAFGPLLFATAALAIPLLLLELRRGRRFEWLHRIAFSRRIAWAEAFALIAYHVGRLAVDCWNGELARSISASASGRTWNALSQLF